jgi:hypothetical protein
MSALPLRFGANSWSYLDRTSFSYSFDKISGMKFIENSELPFQQTNKIPAIGIELEGRSANPNISLSLNGITNLYNIQQLYICSHIPIISDTATNSNAYSLVIEGYSQADVQNKKIIVFIPINTTNTSGTTNNTFDSFNILFAYLKNSASNVSVNTSDNSKSITSLDFDINGMIPKKPFYIYQKIDNDSVNYTVVFFNNSELTMTSTTNDYFVNAFSNNSAQTTYNGLSSTAFEETTNTFQVYKSTVTPTKKASISNFAEDNIYIDCQPVDIPNEKKNYYFQKMDGYGEFLQVGFVYLFSIIFLSILVYGIYNIKTLFKSSADQEISKINQSLQEFSKYVK